ncbi:MAG: DNA-binding protein [Proteobacteria bacterium]|nr:DNA-binding protein [Pseudomonadota bacterium]
MPVPLVSEEELALRWKITPITLSHWRWSGRGPRFLKIGRHVFYRVQDIEAFEEQKAKKSTTYVPQLELLQGNTRKLECGRRVNHQQERFE